MKDTEEARPWGWSAWSAIPAIVIAVLAVLITAYWLPVESSSAGGEEDSLRSLALLVLGVVTLLSPVAVIVGLWRLLVRDYAGLVFLLGAAGVVLAWLAASDVYLCSS